MSAYLFPRLPRPAARQLLKEQREQSPIELRAGARTNHPAAATAPTGGRQATDAVLMGVATAVREACEEQWPEPVSRLQGTSLDRSIGRALVQHLCIVRPDAANEGVWAFLSLVLLPDIAVLRFPDRAEPRMMGGARNVFRRPWERRMVLGELSDRQGINGQLLGEDELVNIFERAHLARSHELARALAEHILSAKVANRSEYAREVTKHVKRQLGAYNVDVLDASAVRMLVKEAASRVSAG